MSHSIPWQQPEIIQHSQRLLRSFLHWTGKPLLQMEGSPEDIAQALFEAPLIVVSHGTEPDPIFNYGNRRALELWLMTWDQFTQTPSRQTAEPTEQDDRNQLLAAAQAKGFIDNYRGIRISSSGRRFQIQDVLLWEVLDEQDSRCGQAAMFERWELI